MTFFLFELVSAGTPQITQCIQTQTINSGDSINPILTIKNIATIAGSFYGSLNCSGEASVNGYITSKYFDAEESADIPIQIAGGNTIAGTTKSASCVVKIMDLKGGGSDTCKFDLNVKYVSGVTCQPGSLTCQDNNLYICNGNGDDVIKYKQCSSGCEFMAGGAKCVEDEYKDKENNSLVYILIISVAIIIGFISLALILKSKKRKHS